MGDTPNNPDPLAGRPMARSVEPVDLKPGAKPGRRVSMRDVAEAAGVSVATVSMVLNNNSRISRGTHMKVQRVIERLGYRPNRLAQSLSSPYTRVLAIMLPPLRHAFADAYFGELISGICDRADRFGHKVMLEHAKPDFTREKKHIELFERRYVDGVLCLGVNHRHGFMQDYLSGDYPVMVVDNYFGESKIDHVVCDYRTGAEQAMNYLLQLGHRKIAHIHGALESHTARDVMEVYLARLEGVGVEPVERWRADGRYTEEGGANAAAKILDSDDSVTAIFAGNDKMALGAMSYLSHRGVRVPEDVSVMGFDDIQHTAFVSPSLTTVHLPLYEVGVRSCERMIERIRRKVDRANDVLPTHLVVRESTAMARDTA